jgi:His/Glu/Gln/Arg/opine family amino acid ABC transporter permease subunit
VEFDFSAVFSNWRFIAEACKVTLIVSLLSILLGLVVGTTVALARVYGSKRVGGLLTFFYIDTMRSVPLLVLLIWTYFSSPLLIGINLDPLPCAVVVLGLHLGAGMAEVIRGGLLSVRRGQFQAALALGMSWWQTVHKVILPQALIRTLPSLGSLVIIGFKDSALASVIAVPELLRQSQILAGQTFRSFEVYTSALLLYVAFLYPITLLIEAVYRRLAARGAA